MSSFIHALARQQKLIMVDGKHDLIVQVADLDVKLGVPLDPHCCAFSRAIRRIDRQILGAHFYRTTVWLEYSNRLVRYILPQDVRLEIGQFDLTHTMRPGTYAVRAPRASYTREAVAARSAKRPGRHQPGNGQIKRNPVSFVTNIRKFEYGFALANQTATKPAAKSTKPAAKSTRPAAKSTQPAAKSTKPAAKSTKPAAKSTKSTVEA